MTDLDRNGPIGCPDAEMLAAWFEGGLAAGERAVVDAHAAACGRCQAHLAALARTAVAEPVSQAKRFRVWPWLVPAAGAAAALTVWVIVQPRTEVPESGQQAPTMVTRDEASTPAAAPTPPAAPRAEADRRESAPALPRARRSPERKVEAPAEARTSAATEEAPATAAPTAPPSAALNQQRAVDMMALRADSFELPNLIVHRSPEGRVTWDAQREGIPAQLTAGASPSPAVIWLVGKGGLVLLSTDGRSWRRLPFPEAVDLTGIEAFSDTAATVTTADARVFTTSDRGATWQRR